ncbi:hypothetical protein [Halopseudomonas salina]|uniref:Uncharacterized protein n=1 Tax=Halopseudomonas salina TaxID=1323744 RepID=A0ABQ1NYH7_9GAMM|nr:hypothetical protein [Halopseudomonas salina]GGC87476.1 hypothetical protein GCM10007418_04040 [Halopseudomonas salina]
MATPTERSTGIRERLSARSNGLSSRTNARADGIQERLDARHQRKAGELVQNLLDMANPGKPLPTLKREEPRGGIPQRRGYSEVNQQPGTGGQGGIAGPLQELDIDQREYYAPLLSSDGLFALPQIKMLQMTDGGGNPFQVQLADPHPPEPTP